MALERPSNGLSTTKEAEEVFINEEAPKIDNTFGGLRLSEGGQVKTLNHFQKLQPALQTYVRQDGRFAWGPNPSKWEWEALFNDIATEEARATQSDQGAFDIFNRMVVRVGNRSDAIDPWINLIPDAYGLCVVKCAFAVLLSRAREYVDKRKAIFDAFLTVRDVIKEAVIKEIHFQTDATVYRCAGDLYEAAVDAIQVLSSIVDDMSRSHKLFRKAKKRENPEILNIAFKNLNDKAKMLSLVVENCRMAILKKIGKDSGQTLKEVTFIRWQSTEIKDLLFRIHQEQFETLQGVQRQQQILEDLGKNRDLANTNLLHMFREESDKFENSTLPAIQQAFQRSLSQSNLRLKSSRAVICLEDLFRILCAPSIDQNFGRDLPLSLDMWRARNRELHIVLAAATKFGSRAQDQAHSLLHQDRFFDWMSSRHPDMIFVDGNIPESARDNLSPMSLLCANLGLTIARREPNSVVAHFYCGLHTSPLSDSWYGPVGMLRSLVFQLLTALVEKNCLDLDFLDHHNYVRGIERHDTEVLCQLFKDVVQQFDASTRIYCIVDDVSKYDVDLRDSSIILRIFLQKLQEIIRLDNLRARFKVLMTVPFRTLPTLRGFLWDDYHLSLPLRTLGTRGLSDRSIDFSISSPSTPSIVSDRFRQLETTPETWHQSEDD